MLLYTDLLTNIKTGATDNTRFVRLTRVLYWTAIHRHRKSKLEPMVIPIPCTAFFTSVGRRYGAGLDEAQLSTL